VARLSHEDPRVVTGSRAAAVAHASLQGTYSGAVSRLAAFALDAVLSYLLFTLALAAVNFSVSIVAGHPVHYTRSGSVVVAVISIVWEFVYFAYCWATTGKTPGMVVLGIRVVRADGGHAEAWRAVVRTLILPISVALFFVSLPLILLQRQHQAPHDLAAGTAVVYAWDARAAKWRLLARGGARQQEVQATEPSAAGTAQPSPTGTAQPSPTGTAQPSPTGTAQPSPTGTAQPSATGDATPAAQHES
jgi:uncharacterized RDD family membrane protein YckC